MFNQFVVIGEEEEENFIPGGQVLCSTPAEESIAAEELVADSGDELCFENISLTELNSEGGDVSAKGKQIRKEIEEWRWFYLKNEKNDIISLKKKTVYNKYKEDTDFIGSKFLQLFIEEKNPVILLTQLVNEREKMKSIGKTLFYRELYLSIRKNSNVQKLFRKYIKEDEINFFYQEKENVDYYRWVFMIHRRRFNQLVRLLVRLDGKRN
eukprot:jgi/Orpsp1_1/1187848/evm.model.d7180000060599.1